MNQSGIPPQNLTADQALSILSQATEPQAKLSRMGYVQVAAALDVFAALIQQHQAVVDELEKSKANQNGTVPMEPASRFATSAKGPKI